MNIYENYYVGAFIHAAGFKAGMRNGMAPNRPDEATAIGLNQQGPKDAPLGDVFWSTGEKHLLIEFKARYKGMDRERLKKARTFLLKAIAEDGDASLRECSEQAHYMAIGGWTTDGGGLLRIGTYSLIAASSNEGMFRVGAKQLEPFIDELLDGKVGADAELFRRYLDVLQTCVDRANADAKTTKSGSSSGGAQVPKKIADAVPGGLLVSVSGSGSMRLLPFDGFEMLQQLQMTLTQVAPDFGSHTLGL